LKRRSRRILPPYYAALILSLLLLALTLSWQYFTGFHWEPLFINFQPGAIPSLEHRFSNQDEVADCSVV
ncbi:MAG TPA: hypothetical protein V6D09_01095, partial [Leptolyngbyaceae cyanobacterium]